MLQSPSNPTCALQGFPGGPHHPRLFLPFSSPAMCQSAQYQPGANNFELPRTLQRREFQEISRFAIESVAPELATIPLEYSRRGLRKQAAELTGGLRALSPSHLPHSLPRAQLSLTQSLTIPLRTSIPSTSLPTHILALTPAPQSSSKPAPNADPLLFPVHAIALVLHCSLLPRLPKSKPRVASGAVTLPVVSLSLPSPGAFHQIQNYLYTHDAAAFVSSLLGSSALPHNFLSALADSRHSARTVEATLSSGQKLHQLSMHISSAMGRDLQAMMSRATVIVGCWRNIVALGISDPDMWDVLDLAYEVLLGAMNLAAGGN